jgi:hypothetical protein
MKKSIISVSALLILVSFLMNGCVKDVTSDFDYGIDPKNQKDLLCKSLRLIGNNKEGTMPVSIGSGLPITVSSPTTVEISAGVLLFLPYTVSDTSKVCKIYLQVDGAGNYWETKLVTDPGSKRPYFSILIPKFVRDGDFNIVFSVGDCSGNVSRKYSTKTIVSPIADCNTTIRGAYGITVRSFDLGGKAGTAGFNYDMFSIPDRLDIRYNGQWVTTTAKKVLDNRTLIPDCSNTSDGFVSNTGKVTFEYNPKVSRFVEVYISGCNSGTAWTVAPICP